MLKTIDFKSEKEAVYKKIETACIIASNGDVYKCFGTNNRVFPDIDLGERLYGVIASHNHPIDETASSFSSADRYMFSHFNLISLRGCDETYVYKLSKKI